MPKRRDGFTKRKRYFIAPAFQLRYIRTILLIMFGVAVLCAYAVYYQMMVILGEKLANVYPQGRLMAIVKGVNIQILLTLLCITPIVVAIGILLSHKIAGPIHRMERMLSDMAKGEIATRVTLRKHDEMKSLADAINLVLESLCNRVSKEVVIAGNIRKEVDHLEECAKSSSFDRAVLDGTIVKLKEGITELDSSLSQYKICATKSTPHS